MGTTERISQGHRFVLTRRPTGGGLSPFESFSCAWRGTLHLLFGPFVVRRWVVLSIVCLFLGGGTSTAAFQWGVGTLPKDLQVSELLFRLRLAIAQHPNLIVLALVLSVGLGLGLIYARCVLRFVLIDAVIKQDVALGEAWKSFQSCGRSYFFWILGVVGAILAAVAVFALISIRYLTLIREAGYPWWVDSLLLVTELLAVVFIGLLAAILIILTDDLVAPLMYASRISLPAAWGTVWKIWRRDSENFLFYIVLRFAVSLAISIAVLIVLFPALMGLSSVAFVTAALVNFALRVVGLAWAWTPLTISLGALALLAFTALLFALLSVIGMPGQVYLQNYGVSFIASRVAALGDHCHPSVYLGRQR